MDIVNNEQNSNIVFCVFEEFHNQDQQLSLIFATKDKAKAYLKCMADGYVQQYVKWHKSKELFQVVKDGIKDKFYIKEMTVL